ncbi:hypothetical protein [Bradyrhizobium archetypum]|jgi:hypothetical protein|uniref:Uncharacterized protein n=1 Tax=Bradyrhizobium archetypum TaxID=2721160 RepID=A0A7Y4H740_9BRAD|nr:hypothetical protein [Bradyrhizobium archetypum]NOJ48755.1 hypothetical protein [Bradyrhizobium archetypum]
MASQSKSQSNSGFNRRFFLAAAAAGGAMIPVAAQAAPKKRGVYTDPKPNLTDKVADFSYQNDVLAQWIVDIWTGPANNPLIWPTGSSATTSDYKNRSDAAKSALEARGIYLAKPIVITEDEYDDGFSLADANIPADTGVVLVVPRYARATNTPPKPLLETAKMLMAVTPNGI